MARHQPQQQRYDLVRYDSEEARERDPEGPPIENQCAAAAYVASRIQQARGDYALIGGFALRLMGSQRATRDVDMVTGLNMAQIWSVIEGDPRLIIPQSRMVADIVKIFVKTGHGYDECVLNKNVEIDIIRPGVNGTPRDASSATALVRGGSIFVSGRVTEASWQTLDVPHILRTKIRASNDRGYDRDLQDVVFLMTAYQQKVRDGRGVLRSDELESFLRSDSIDDEDKTFFKTVLGLK